MSLATPATRSLLLNHHHTTASPNHTHTHKANAVHPRTLLEAAYISATSTYTVTSTSVTLANPNAGANWTAVVFSQPTVLGKDFVQTTVGRREAGEGVLCGVLFGEMPGARRRVPTPPPLQMQQANRIRGVLTFSNASGVDTAINGTISRVSKTADGNPSDTDVRTLVAYG